MSANKPYNRIENPYLKLGFWEFLAFSTLIIFLFPWSIIFCLIYYGFEETKLILLALIEDFAKTLLAIVIVVLSLIIIIITSLILWLKQPDETDVGMLNNDKTYQIVTSVSNHLYKYEINKG